MVAAIDRTDALVQAVRASAERLGKSDAEVARLVGHALLKKSAPASSFTKDARQTVTPGTQTTSESIYQCDSRESLGG